jgi:hypothetical protein
MSDLPQLCLQHVARLESLGQERRAMPYLGLAAGSITLVEVAPGQSLQLAAVPPPRCLVWLFDAHDDHAGPSGFPDADALLRQAQRVVIAVSPDAGELVYAAAVGFAAAGATTLLIETRLERLAEWRSAAERAGAGWFLLPPDAVDQITARGTVH